MKNVFNKEMHVRFKGKLDEIAFIYWTDSLVHWETLTNIE